MAKKGRKEKPLAYGVFAPAGPLKHIHQVPASENGALCNCLCPGCGGELVAVNADKDSDYLAQPGHQQPFFRHANGKQQFSCLISAARAAAFDLLMKEDVVVLPERQVTPYGRQFSGTPLGEVLAAKAGSQSIQVVGRRWIDSFAGVLTLPDGTEVLVTAHVDSTVITGEGFDRVIRIDCDDPNVATMKPEQILSLLRSPDSSIICWHKHGDEQALLEQANEMAQEYLAGIPPELIAGMDVLHANETVLHWLIKKAITETPFLRVPGLRGALISRHPKLPPPTVDVPPMVLEVKDAKLEKWLGGIVPDVICKARIRGSSDDWFDLLIEAAVTHRADPQKIARIRQMELGAIEVRSDLFKRVGAIKASTIAKDICNDPSNKVWLFHPLYSKYEEAVQGEYDFLVRQQVASERADREAVDWLQRLETPQLYKIGYAYLQAGWGQGVAPRLPHHSVNFAAVQQELARRQENPLRSSLVSGPDGLLAALGELGGYATATPGRGIVALLSDAFSKPHESKVQATYLLLAIECWGVSLTQSEARYVSDLRTEIDFAFSNGASAYRRSATLDALLVNLFPEFGGKIASDFGSQGYATQLRQAAQAREQEAARQRDIELRAQREEEERLFRMELDQARDEARQKALAVALEDAGRRWAWNRPTSLTNTSDATVKLALRQSTVEHEYLATASIARVGWSSRQEGKTIPQALKALGVRTADDCTFVLLVWNTTLLARKVLT